MPSLFQFTDYYRTTIGSFKALVVLASAIFVSVWYLNTKKQTGNEKQQQNLLVFFLLSVAFLGVLFLDILYPQISYSFTYVIAFSLTLLWSNTFLIGVILPFTDPGYLRAIRRGSISISLAVSLFILLNPIHRTITVSPSGDQLHWLVNIFLYYGLACILIGFFMYFSNNRRTKEWNNGILALILTALYILFIGYALPFLYEWDIFVILYTTYLYFLCIFDLIFRSQRTPYYVRSLPIFEEADIMMSIISQDGHMRYASHAVAKQSEIINELDPMVIAQADGNLHILDLDDTIYQWSVNPVDNNYLITIENITDLMLDVRKKQKEKEELERQQIVMGTQSSIEQEMERIEFRLKLLANVETETRPQLAILREHIQQISGPVESRDIELVKIISRFIKRRALILLAPEERFPINWINLVSQELLDVSFGEHFAIHVNPNTLLEPVAMRRFQDIMLQVALDFIDTDVELLASVRNYSGENIVNLLFQTGENESLQAMIRERYQEHSISCDEESVRVQIGLEVAYASS